MEPTFDRAGGNAPVKRKSSRRVVQVWTVDGDVASLVVRRRNGDEYLITVSVDSLPIVGRFTWWIDMGQGKRTPYAATTVWDGPYKSKNLLMHRMIADTPIGQLTDHRDGNGLRNVRSNLRIADETHNRANELARRPPRGSREKSKYKGVSRAHGSRGGWAAYIGMHGKTTKLGTWDREVDAALAYDDAARELFGEFAATNFTPEDAACVERIPRRRRPGRTHGSSGYAKGCRCEACVEGARAYRASRRTACR